MPPLSRPPSLLAASLRVFDLSLGQMLWSRRTIFMALVVGAPVFIAVVVRLITAINPRGIVVHGAAAGGGAVFGMLVWLLYLRFAVPVLALFYGTALIADEVEDKTITYLFTRPIPRGSVLIGKYLAYLACTVMVVLPSVMLVYLLTASGGGGGLAANFPALLADLGLLAVGLAAYGAVFAFIGAWFKRPVMTGLFVVFGWEPTVMSFPGYLKRFTVAHYLQALVPHAMPQDSLMGMLQSVFRESPRLSVSLVMLALIVAVFLFAATRVVDGREYVLEQ